MQIYVDNQIKIKNRYLTDSLLKWIRIRLRFINPEHQSALQSGSKGKYLARNIPKYIYGYHTTPKHLFIDRGFLIPLTNYLYDNNIDFSIINKTVSKKHDLTLTGIKLRDYQQRAVKSSLNRRGGVIIQPCGGGKTVTLLALLRELNEHTIIFVHTTFLLDQWIKYIKDFLGYDAGIIHGKKVDIKPITVAMIQTMYNRELNDKFLSKWGCVLVDETHHVPANMFHSVVSAFPAKYRFGASATINRSDLLTKMIFSIMGPTCYRISSNKLSELGYIRIPSVILRDTDFTTYSRKYQSMINGLIQDTKRNELIVEDIVNNSNRFNLVLSSRIEHLETLADLYSKYSDDYAVVIGKVKAKEREEIIERMRSGKLHTIFATQLADEGLDIPILDTLYLVYPTKARGRLEQRIGRIQRISKGKSLPLVYDYVDNWVSSLFRQSQHRMRLYQDLELNILNGN